MFLTGSNLVSASSVFRTTMGKVALLRAGKLTPARLAKYATRSDSNVFNNHILRRQATIYIATHPELHAAVKLELAAYEKSSDKQIAARAKMLLDGLGDFSFPVKVSLMADAEPEKSLPSIEVSSIVLNAEQEDRNRVGTVLSLFIGSGYWIAAKQLATVSLFLEFVCNGKTCQKIVLT